jgi:hypothetical protein
LSSEHKATLAGLLLLLMGLLAKNYTCNRRPAGDRCMAFHYADEAGP